MVGPTSVRPGVVEGGLAAKISASAVWGVVTSNAGPLWTGCSNI